VRSSLYYEGFKQDMEYFEEEYMQQHSCLPNQPKIRKLKHPNKAAMPSILYYGKTKYTRRTESRRFVAL